MQKEVEIKQKLNNYVDEYRSYNKWLKKETEHYVFHYLPESEAQVDIEKIAERQEKAYKKIVNILNIEEPKQKVRYYLYPDQKTKEKLMGDGGYAQSIYHDFTIHVVYTREINPMGEHEDTHLLTLPWGLSIGFFQEGLAEYMAGNRNWQGKTQEFWLKEALEKNIISGVESMMTQKAWMDSPDEHAPYYYIFARSFVEFLIESFGIEKFREFYSKTSRLKTKEENVEVFDVVYKISLFDIEKKWRKTLI